LPEVVPVYRFWGGDCDGGEGYRLVIASHLVIDFPTRGIINSIYGDQFDQMLVILHIVAIRLYPGVSRLGGTKFSLFIRMISNLAVVAVCTDHEDQTKKVLDEKKKNE